MLEYCTRQTKSCNTTHMHDTHAFFFILEIMPDSIGQKVLVVVAHHVPET